MRPGAFDRNVSREEEAGTGGDQGSERRPSATPFLPSPSLESESEESPFLPVNGNMPVVQSNA